MPALQELGEDELHSYQFSVTEHLRRIETRALNTEAAGGLLPGTFFNYELSPMRVRIEERRNSLLHFLTRVCAIIGGVFTVMGVVVSSNRIALAVASSEAGWAGRVQAVRRPDADELG